MQASSNPAFSQKAIARLKDFEGGEKMTVAGSMSKTAYAMAVLLAGAVAGWALLPQITQSLSWVWLVGFAVTLTIFGLITAFKSNYFTVTIYALLEGAMIGMISRGFETAYNGIVLQAVLFTLATTLGMLMLYSSGMIKVTQKLKSIVMIATVGVVLYALFAIVVSLFNPSFVTVVSTGPLGIVIAAVIVLIAAFNLLLDFDFVSTSAEQGLSKKVEWYAAFGLLVTIVWLYLSILRLLAATNRK